MIFVGIAEYAGRFLAKNAFSECVCIVAICRSCRHRSVAVGYCVKQFLKQCGIECSSALLSRHEWSKRSCNGECDDCFHLSDWAPEMANSAADKM
eukprot:3325939-Pyramimonas_sp.AAC.1